MVDAFDGWEVPNVRDQLLNRYVLPPLGARARAALRIPVAKIGMPYVWGGETDRASRFFGGQVHGGYDCSGLVWRTFKMTGIVRSIGGAPPRRWPARSRALSASGSRTCAGGPPLLRSAKFWQKATERRITHMGIALGNGWMINSSSQGVALIALEGWRAESFAWARRVL